MSSYTLNSIKKEIAEIKSMLQVNNLINIREAAKLLDREESILRARMSKGEYILNEHYIITRTRERLFYKDKILAPHD